MNKVINNKSINLKKVSNPYIPFGVKLASVPKTPYAPFKKGEPKGHGTEMINTGYEWTMNNQASTTRANTLMYSVGNTNYNSWRASDSYPLAAWYGDIIYNPTGAMWTFANNKFIPNAPAQQIEIACKNIEADIIAGMYTDLVITNYNPKYLNDSLYPTSIFVRYIRALMLNTKVIISAVKRLSQLLALNEYLSNVSSLFVNRSNILVTEVTRRRFTASMEMLNVALKQIPIHKDIWKSYSGLWNVSFDPSKLNSTYTYVTPGWYDSLDENYDNVQKFCTIAETESTDAPSLIFTADLMNSIGELESPGKFISNFLEATDDDFRTYVTNIVQTYSEMFRKLSLGISAMSVAFQPFIVAMIRVGDKYFSDVLERNPDIRDLIQTQFTEFKDFEIMGMLHSYTPSITNVNNGRTVSMTVPLFNSFTPIDMFRKNGVLMCKSLDVTNDPSSSYKAIIDVTNVWPHTLHFWYQSLDDNTHGAFQKVSRDCSAFPGKHRLIKDIPTDLTFNVNFKIDPHAISDLGIYQYLQNNVVAYVAKADNSNRQTYYYHKDLCGFRSVSFEPVLDQLMERAPYVFGVNSELAKAIKA